MEGVSPDFRENLLELTYWLQKENDSLAAVIRAFSKEKIKELYRTHSLEFLIAGITQLTELEEYKWCQAFKELVDERLLERRYYV